MWGVVNEPDGTTSGQVKLQNIDFSGKTGTAQVESFDLQNKLGKKLKENGWFVGYAPRRNPDIVVAALVQSGGWGSTSAAPDRPRRREGLLRQEKRPSATARLRTAENFAPSASPALRVAKAFVAAVGAAPMKDRPRVNDFDWTLLAIVGRDQRAWACSKSIPPRTPAPWPDMQWKQLMWIGIGLAGCFSSPASTITP